MGHLPELVVADLDPKLTPRKAGRRLFRLHANGVDADAFNPGYGRGRFHPIEDEAGKVIPTLYAADRINGALSESVFRDITAAGGRVHREELRTLVLSRLIQQTDLQLIDLTGLALRRLGLTRVQLLDAPPRHYRETARWAEALHRACPAAHGLMWVSRQFDTSKVMVLFGDRIADMVLRDAENSESLYGGRGFQRVCEAAALGNITVID